MNAKKLSTIFVVLFVVWAALSLRYGPLELRSDDFTLFGKVIGSLILISAIMERVLDVFLTFFYAESADMTTDALEAAERELAAAKAALEAAPNDQAATSEFSTAEASHRTAQAARRDQRTKTRQSALPAAIVLGVLISAIGFRALNSLVAVMPTVAADSWWAQPNVFHTVDIVLTGVVLAGGSDGLHKLMEVYRSVMEKKR